MEYAAGNEGNDDDDEGLRDRNPVIRKFRLQVSRHAMSRHGIGDVCTRSEPRSDCMHDCLFVQHPAAIGNYAWGVRARSLRP